jgi:hypothetical protein
MPDPYPLQPDADWYGTMRSRYGDSIVPSLDRLQFRRGFQKIIEDLFEKLHDVDRFQACSIKSIRTRSACFTVIAVEYGDKATTADERMCNRVIDRIRERLAEACEHCGHRGQVIAKAGLETLLSDPDAVLGDRLLCSECYEQWRVHD